MIYNYKKYIFKKFSINFAKVTFIFAAVILIMNLFEEISFFKDNEEFILLPIYLTLLNSNPLVPLPILFLKELITF